ncbi:hypothetical protein ES705_36373 [subsurface metagenome]
MVLDNPRKSPMTIKTGSYVGDGGDDVQIATGFKCSFVIITRDDATKAACMFSNKCLNILDASQLTGGSGLHATDGFTVYNTGDIINVTDKTYKYWAIATA